MALSSRDLAIDNAQTDKYLLDQTFAQNLGIQYFLASHTVHVWSSFLEHLSVTASLHINNCVLQHSIYSIVCCTTFEIVLLLIFWVHFYQLMFLTYLAVHYEVLQNNRTLLVICAYTFLVRK